MRLNDYLRPLFCAAHDYLRPLLGAAYDYIYAQWIRIRLSSNTQSNLAIFTGPYGENPRDSRKAWLIRLGT